MSVNVDMSPRDLWWGILKIVAALSLGLVLVAYVLTELVTAGDSRFPIIGIVAVALALAVNILASGFLAILKIIDWFEERRLKRETTNG